MQFVDQSNNIGVYRTDEAETLAGKPRKRPHISAVIGMTGGQRRLRAGGFPISKLEPHNKIPLGFQFGKIPLPLRRLKHGPEYWTRLFARWSAPTGNAFPTNPTQACNSLAG
jgi:hypothetical protein